MGKSRTPIYQIGKWYKVGGMQALAAKHSTSDDIVEFEIWDINHPFKNKIQRKQRYR